MLLGAQCMKSFRTEDGPTRLSVEVRMSAVWRRRGSSLLLTTWSTTP